MALGSCPHRAGGRRSAHPGWYPRLRDGCFGSAACASHSATRSPLDDLAGLPPDEAAHVATERLKDAITELEEALA